MNIRVNQNEIKAIKIGEGSYPKKLQHIYAPPKILYVLGNDKILNHKAIAMVGCRDCSEYGKKIAYQLAQEFARKNITVISGLARGIDTYAHKGVLFAKGKTIAIVGCGLDIIYPPENRELYKQILQNGGAIISEYPLGTKPLKQHFPARNRIISGLSDGLLIVEAKERSGTLITVEHALEQGKDVYAVPRKYIKPSITRNQ